MCTWGMILPPLQAMPLGNEMETLPLNLVPPFPKYQVVKSGVRVLCNDENARIEFKAKALSKRLDEGFPIQRTGIATVRRLLAESKT